MASVRSYQRKKYYIINYSMKSWKIFDKFLNFSTNYKVILGTPPRCEWCHGTWQLGTKFFYGFLTFDVGRVWWFLTFAQLINCGFLTFPKHQKQKQKKLENLPQRLVLYLKVLYLNLFKDVCRYSNKKCINSSIDQLKNKIISIGL